MNYFTENQEESRKVPVSHVNVDVYFLRDSHDHMILLDTVWFLFHV